MFIQAELFDLFFKQQNPQLRVLLFKAENNQIS